LRGDLLDIYDLAVNSDPALREAEQTLYATREVKPQARALLLPDFSLQGDAQYQDVQSSGNSTFRAVQPQRQLRHLRRRRRDVSRSTTAPTGCG
jgi:outer membrane protein TolC